MFHTYSCSPEHLESAGDVRVWSWTHWTRMTRLAFHRRKVKAPNVTCCLSMRHRARYDVIRPCVVVIFAVRPPLTEFTRPIGAVFTAEVRVEIPAQRHWLAIDSPEKENSTT